MTVRVSTLTRAASVKIGVLVIFAAAAIVGGLFIHRSADAQATGTVEFDAEINGQPWYGTINVNITGPGGPYNNVTIPVPSTFTGRAAGAYQVTYLGGLPWGTQFERVAPGSGATSNSRTLDPGGSTKFTFRFNAPDFRLGIQFSDEGPGCSAQTGTTQYATYSTIPSTPGSAASLWAADSNRYDPDCAKLHLTLPNGVPNGFRAATDLRACVQMADDFDSTGFANGTGITQIGTKRCTPWLIADGEGNWTDWAGDSGSDPDPDGARVFIETQAMPSTPSKIIDDLQFSLHTNATPNAVSPVVNTPWAAANGGSTGWAYPPGTDDLDAMQIKLVGTYKNVGTVKFQATAAGQPWSTDWGQPIVIKLQRGDDATSTVAIAVPSEFRDLKRANPAPGYQVTWVSGGPCNCAPTSITSVPAGGVLTSGDTLTFTLNFPSANPGGGNNTGLIRFEAYKGMIPWEGSLVANVNGPAPIGSQPGVSITVPSEQLSQPTGAWSFQYVSGGPGGVASTTMNPADGVLTPGGTLMVRFTFPETPPPPPPGNPVTCNPTNQVINRGQTANFSATNGTSTYTWAITPTAGVSQSSGSGNTFASAFNNAGTYTATVTNSGRSAQCIVQVNDTPTVNPLTASCAPNKTSPAVNESVTWTSSVSGGVGPYTYAWSGTDGLSGTANSASKSYATAGTKTATLTVRDSTPGGVVNISCTPSVSVGGACPTCPVNCSLTLDKACAMANTNAQVTVRWTASGATQCTASGGTPGWDGNKSVTGGSQVFSLNSSRMFSLVCVNGSGVSRQCVALFTGLAPTLTLSPASTTINPGATQMFTGRYDPDGPDDFMFNPQPVNNVTGYTGTWSSSNTTVAIATSTSAGRYLAVSPGVSTINATYSVDRCGPQSAASGSAVLNVRNPSPAPTCSSANSSITAGSSNTFTASGGNGTYTWSIGPTAGVSPTTGTGTTITPTFTQAGTYTATVTSASQTAQCTLPVNPPPPPAAPTTLFISFNANPTFGSHPLNTNLSTRITGGTATGTSNFSFWWNCNSNATSVAVATGACGDPNNPSIGAKFNATTSVAVDLPHVYTNTGTSPLTFQPKVIVERGGGPNSAQQGGATITVNPQLPTVSLTASPTSVPLNGSATLSWNTSLATSCTASNNQGNPSWQGSKPLSSTGFTVNNIDETTDFRLTCSNSAGSVFDTRTVGITAASCSSFSVAPTQFFLPPGSQVRFNWACSQGPCEVRSASGAVIASGGSSATSVAGNRPTARTTYFLWCNSTLAASSTVRVFRPGGGEIIPE